MNEFFVQIDKLIKGVVENPYFGLVGFLIGIAGLIFSYYIAKRDKRSRELKCMIVSTNLIAKSESLFPKLSIKYDNQDLVSFTSTKIRIKNAGTEVLKMSDIAKSDPITFITKTSNNAFLLDFGIIYTSDALNNFSIEKITANSIKLSFDYIEPKDTVVVQLLHTGKENADIEIKGAVIGAKEPFVPKDNGDVMSPKSPILRKLVSMNPRVMTISVLSAMILILGAISYFTYWLTTNIFVGSLCLLPVIFLLWTLIKIVVAKPDKERDVLSRDIMLSAFGQALDKVERENKNSL